MVGISCAGTQIVSSRCLESFFRRTSGFTANMICAIRLNSQYFHIIGDKLINPIVRVYIAIIRVPY